MRLDFNIALIDDDLGDSQRERGVNRLEQLLGNHIRKKGFNPCFKKEKSSVAILGLSTTEKKRIDLYLSDNNLSNNSQQHNINEEDGGIELYLKLKEQFICDFILYSRSDKSTIVTKLVKDLSDKQNPNLFTRFSFIERNSTNEQWVGDILNIVNHIITRREELNNLRGVFAQVMSRVHHKMIERYGIPANLSLADSIKYANDNRKITQSDYIELLGLKNIRNGLLHNDEFICPDKQIRCVTYKRIEYSSILKKISERDDYIYETDDFDVYRRRLYTLYDRFK